MHVCSKISLDGGHVDTLYIWNQILVLVQLVWDFWGLLFLLVLMTLQTMYI